MKEKLSEELIRKAGNNYTGAADHLFIQDYAFVNTFVMGRFLFHIKEAIKTGNRFFDESYENR